MLIAHWIQVLVAVLGFAAVIPPVRCNEHFNTTQFRRSLRKHHQFYSGHDDYYHNQSIPLSSPGEYLNGSRNKHLLRMETRLGGGKGVDCCPSVLEMIEPINGKKRDGQLVHLWREGNDRQRFYEISCHSDILEKPCRFMDRKLHEQSRCIQKYSYTYALVLDPGGHHHQSPKNFPSFPASGNESSTWTLDYIRVRSGCACVVIPNKKKRDRPKHHRKQRPMDDMN